MYFLSPACCYSGKQKRPSLTHDSIGSLCFHDLALLISSVVYISSVFTHLIVNTSCVYTETLVSLRRYEK